MKSRFSRACLPPSSNPLSLADAYPIGLKASKAVVANSPFLSEKLFFASPPSRSNSLSLSLKFNFWRPYIPHIRLQCPCRDPLGRSKRKLVFPPLPFFPLYLPSLPIQCAFITINVRPSVRAKGEGNHCSKKGGRLDRQASIFNGPFLPSLLSVRTYSPTPAKGPAQLGQTILLSFLPSGPPYFSPLQLDLSRNTEHIRTLEEGIPAH